MSNEERLVDIIYKLQNEVARLNEELSNSQAALSSSEFRVKQELEPRIRREDQAYDMWVTSLSREAQDD